MMWNNPQKALGHHGIDITANVDVTGDDRIGMMTTVGF